MEKQKQPQLVLSVIELLPSAGTHSYYSTVMLHNCAEKIIIIIDVHEVIQPIT